MINNTNNSKFISKQFIDNLLDNTNVEDIIQDFVTLKKEGANLKGLTPFGSENTPSFIVSPSKQIWKDFSSGKGGNNAVSFLMAMDYTYLDAIHYIAKKQGLTVQYDNSKEAKAYQERLKKINDLRPILNKAIAIYQNEFFNLPKEHPAKIEVFDKRKYKQEIIDTYQIGYAPGKRFIYKNLKESGNVDGGVKTSLLNKKQDGYLDFYNDRVTYPIFDKNGEVIGIAGRELKTEPKIKWLNSRTTDLYNKQLIWYGLNFAKQEIRQNKEVYIMEGYNDVIAWQTNGLLNAVAPCGTSIHDNQIKVIKKYADTVYFCMDDDDAGKKSTLKNIPRFIEAGFICYVIKFKECDPDEFVRVNSNTLKTKSLIETLNKETEKVEGFRLLLEELNNKDELKKGIIAKALCEIISKIKDDSIVSLYSTWLKKASGVNILNIRKWIKEYQNERIIKEKERFIANNEYELPKDVVMNEDLSDDIKRYQMFQSNNKIYSQIGSEYPIKFRVCSNFSVNIIQHMRDEDFPKKLVSAENTFNESFVFDVPSETFNVSAAFQKAMTNFGNFRWHGRSEDLVRLQALLFDKMGNGRSLDVLGWQPEGFFLFNNLVVVPNEDNIDLDKNGCFKYKDISYYVPSANEIYANNHYKYIPQKNFRHISGTISSLDYFDKVHQVHGNHAISTIFHAIACMFHDIVAKNLKGFPINFNYGPPGTGKDQLNHAVKSLWGIPQVATNLEAKNSTKTATIRELAQFTNGLIEWSEYARGDNELDGTLKSVWDLRGKKIGKFESRIATDNVPILSGVALTGNAYPDNPAIITRIIWNDMNKTEFTENDEKNFNELNDIIEEGLTHITIKILNQRKLVEDNFNEQYRLLMDVYQRRLPDCNKRMLKNISTLTAFYNVLKENIDFPFTQSQILEHFTVITKAQMRKLSSSSIVTRWWDCFVASMRGVDHDIIKVGRDIKLDGSMLYFQYSNCYTKIYRQWSRQYSDNAPVKNTMKEALEKDPSYSNYKDSIQYNTGGLNRIRSSAMIVDISKMPNDVRVRIKSEVNRQEFENDIEPYTSKSPLNKGNNELWG
ncbi:DNA primase [Winogradskyella sediminis]|uniref:DNA primase n=1 Tax=Winogradskyella sediminis TaxID=1382466 RepID=UPI000E234D2B|nr:DNA primase [Winogradskyella sediminis]REG89898.1 DNA primase catalytic core [Winogradskyella sediminis]